jgi:hypothetical protein
MQQIDSDLLGYAAAGLVLLTFSVRSIAALRSVAIASNLMFIAYAALAHLLPVLILHALLLPLNVWRLRQDLASNEDTREPTLKQCSHPDCLKRRTLHRAEQETMIGVNAAANRSSPRYAADHSRSIR